MADGKKIRSDDEQVLRLNKGKRGLLNLVFGRTSLIILLLAAQVLLMFGAFFRLGRLYYSFSFVSSVVVSLIVYNQVKKPAVKTTWIFLIMLAPVFSVPLYFFIETDLGHRLIRRRLVEIREETRGLLPPDIASRETLRRRDPGTARLADYVYKVNGQSIYRDTEVKYFPSGESVFEEMLEQIRQAEHFIFIEFFIIEEGYMWGRILSLLEEKLREGVEIRVIYDGTCAVAKVPYNYAKQLEAVGIPCKMYAPLRPLVSTHYNNRDHRKILVIDGQRAFTGGVNLADEYINRKVLHGHWKDTAVMLRGRAVQSFTMMFLQMWNVDLGRGAEDYGKYLSVTQPVAAEGYVMPYGDSPFDREPVAESVYMDILNRATRYVHIMTPYLVIDDGLVTALTYAAKRGVEVKLMTPGVPDKKMVFALTRSHYKELISAGVQIYEYTPGFVHSKMFTSDDTTAVVGSINLDYRSLDLNFECAAFLYESPAVADVERDMQETLAKCRRITLEDIRKWSPLQKIKGWVLRPLAPLV